MSTKSERKLTKYSSMIYIYFPRVKGKQFKF